jgi:nicotinamidase-related amidase
VIAVLTLLFTFALCLGPTRGAKIQHYTTPKKGQPGTEIDSRIHIISNQIFGKPKGDSFSNPDFEKYLVENRIDNLVLCGLDARFCIYHTAIGAVNRGYKVTIVTDAIAMKDQSKLGNMLRKYKKRGFALIRTGDI